MINAAVGLGLFAVLAVVAGVIERQWDDSYDLYWCAAVAAAAAVAALIAALLGA